MLLSVVFRLHVFVNELFLAPRRVRAIFVLLWLACRRTRPGQDALVTVGRPAALYSDRTARWTKVTETAMTSRRDGQVCPTITAESPSIGATALASR